MKLLVPCLRQGIHYRRLRLQFGQEADLSNADVEGAHFGGNLGISPETKQDLIARKAVFIS